MCGKLNTSTADTLIILGDAGINYAGGTKEYWFKHKLSEHLPIGLLCVHGNHERRPESVGTYQEARWHGGIVYAEPQFPNLLFAKDGEIYDIAGKKCIAIGGAYSVDKPLRLAQGWHWFADEQPSPEIKARVEQRLAAVDWKVDVVLSHTCPLKYEPREWIGAAPVFDTGTSLWHDKLTHDIRPQAMQPSKPFHSDHAEQIKRVTSFDWLDLSALRGIDEECSEILRGSAFIDAARRDALCCGLRKRVEMLGEVVRGQHRQRGQER